MPSARRLRLGLPLPAMITAAPARVPVRYAR
jgi:hypothetical protein